MLGVLTLIYAFILFVLLITLAIWYDKTLIVRAPPPTEIENRTKVLKSRIKNMIRDVNK